MADQASVDQHDGSFDKFFRLEYTRLAALAAAMCGNREDGRDLAQEALSRAYASWDDVAMLDRPGAWARRVVVNLVRDRARHREVRRRRKAAIERDAVDRIHVEPPFFDADFWAAVARLPDRQRTAVALYYIGDRSIADVAEVMGVAEGSVKTTLHQARKRLRTVLGEEDGR